MTTTTWWEGIAAILSYFQIRHPCCKNRHVSKSTFLFVEAPQNSISCTLREKVISANSAAMTNRYLHVVREKVTSARMHQWCVLNVSVNMRFLCFVLLIQETEMGLPKRDLMLQWLYKKTPFSPCNFLEMVGLPKILQSECSTTISFAALRISTLLYTQDLVALYICVVFL